jgi:ribonuclease HII
MTVCRPARARAIVAGVDEVGRGPLAGPVVAAAVVLGRKRLPDLGDSKQKTPREREELFTAIRASARAIGIGMASVSEIDRYNILRASLLAMRRAVADLPIAPAQVLVDGLHCPDVPCDATAIVGGDASVAAISAASIVAKVTRDRIMCTIDRYYPDYGFARHKGYSTPEHLAALERCGVTLVHRSSFAPVRRLTPQGSW